MQHTWTPGRENTGGVTVYPTPITKGEEINVIYDGLLDQSGASSLWLHYGFGPHEQWQATTDVRMFKTGRGWEQTMTMHEKSRFNFCFRDSAMNWDNNSGHNWSYEIHDG